MHLDWLCEDLHRKMTICHSVSIADKMDTKYSCCSEIEILTIGIVASLAKVGIS